jgi:hypothetical protein
VKEIMCQVCGRVKVAIVEGSVKLRPGAKIVCSACVPPPQDSCDVVDDLMDMMGMRPRCEKKN